MSRKLRILVAEDDEAWRGTLVEILESFGHHVTAAARGDTARGLIRARVNAFDLLVTDRRMPGAYGEQLIQEFKMLNSGARAMMITADDLHEITRDTILSFGANEILKKPIKLEELRAAIERLSPDDFGT